PFDKSGDHRMKFLIALLAASLLALTPVQAQQELLPGGSAPEFAGTQTLSVTATANSLVLPTPALEAQNALAGMVILNEGPAELFWTLTLPGATNPATTSSGNPLPAGVSTCVNAPTTLRVSQVTTCPKFAVLAPS